MIGVENEGEGVDISAHGAGSGFEWVRWRWARIVRLRSSIRWRRDSRISGGRGGVCVAKLTALP